MKFKLILGPLLIASSLSAWGLDLSIKNSTNETLRFEACRPARNNNCERKDIAVGNTVTFSDLTDLPP